MKTILKYTFLARTKDKTPPLQLHPEQACFFKLTHHAKTEKKQYGEVTSLAHNKSKQENSAECHVPGASLHFKSTD